MFWKFINSRQAGAAIAQQRYYTFKCIDYGGKNAARFGLINILRCWTFYYSIELFFNDLQPIQFRAAASTQARPNGTGGA